MMTLMLGLVGIMLRGRWHWRGATSRRVFKIDLEKCAFALWLLVFISICRVAMEARVDPFVGVIANGVSAAVEVATASIAPKVAD
jgi:hypothetical protein